jgi:hypothetical protein
MSSTEDRPEATGVVDGLASADRSGLKIEQAISGTLGE